MQASLIVDIAVCSAPVPVVVGVGHRAAEAGPVVVEFEPADLFGMVDVSDRRNAFGLVQIAEMQLDVARKTLRGTGQR